MKAVRILVMVLFMSFAFVHTANATGYFQTGNTLFGWALEFDKSQRGEDCDLTLASLFLTYVNGVHDGIILTTKYLDHVSNEVTSSQFAAIFAKYLIEHPEKRHMPACGLYLEAISKQFKKPTQ